MSRAFRSCFASVKAGASSTTFAEQRAGLGLLAGVGRREGAPVGRGRARRHLRGPGLRRKQRRVLEGGGQRGAHRVGELGGEVALEGPEVGGRPVHAHRAHDLPGLDLDDARVDAQRARQIEEAAEHQLLRAQQLAEPRRRRRVHLARRRELLLLEDRLEARALDDADLGQVGEIGDQHLRQPLAQRLELGLLAAVVEVEDGDGRLDRLAGGRSFRARRALEAQAARTTTTIRSAMRRAGRVTRRSSVRRPRCQGRPPPSLTPVRCRKQDRAMAASALVLSAALWAATPAGARRARPPPTVAVSYFDNNTGKAEYDPLAKGLADMLITDLGQVRALRVVEREKLNQILAELKLSRSKFIDPKTAQRSARGSRRSSSSAAATRWRATRSASTRASSTSRRAPC